MNKISKIVKENNSYFIVDAAQSCPHLKIDVKKMNVDAISFSGHKMLGPTGIGILYVKEELLKQLDLYQVGGGTIVDVSLNNVKYAKYPSKYEAGTPNIAGAIGLKSAINYLNKVGMNNIEEHEKELSKMLVNGLNDLNANIIGNTTKDKLGVVIFNFDNFNPN
jgi:cysteine desulfurase/selenocysteine lyase